MLASKFVCSVFMAAVVALVPSSVNKFVVPLTRAPDTVKSTAVAVPVSAGLAKGAFNATSVVFDFKFSAVWVAVETGLFTSEVLSTLAKPTPVFVKRDASAFKFKAVVVAVETGLFASEVLSTFAKLTMAFVIPLTVPVKVGLARGALAASEFVIVVTKFASLFNAAASSDSVSSKAGAEPTTAAI